MKPKLMKMHDKARAYDELRKTADAKGYACIGYAVDAAPDRNA